MDCYRNGIAILAVIEGDGLTPVRPEEYVTAYVRTLQQTLAQNMIGM